MDHDATQPQAAQLPKDPPRHESKLVEAPSTPLTSDPDVGAFGSTDRLLTLSDGIFAFAITLLVLDLKVPAVQPAAVWGAQPAVGRVLEALLAQWPAYLAYLLSFANVGMMWINHVTLYRYIKRADHTLTILNALLLLCISLNPFITSMLAGYLVQAPAYQEASMLVYTGVWFVTAVLFNAIWFYALAGRRLIDQRISPAHYADISRRYWVGPFAYLVIFSVALSGRPIASLVMSICLSLLFALPYNASKVAAEAQLLQENAERRLFPRLFKGN